MTWPKTCLVLASAELSGQPPIVAEDKLAQREYALGGGISTPPLPAPQSIRQPLPLWEYPNHIQALARRRLCSFGRVGSAGRAIRRTSASRSRLDIHRVGGSAQPSTIEITRVGRTARSDWYVGVG